ncbi:hypothetical protein ACFL6N_04200 [Thermodesulfobacteriota bacterium]
MTNRQNGSFKVMHFQGIVLQSVEFIQAVTALEALVENNGIQQGRLLQVNEAYALEVSVRDDQEYVVAVKVTA